MNLEVKAEWLEALRSGNYKQTTRKLKKDGGYCCLGVLCDVYTKKNKDMYWSGDAISYNDNGIVRGQTLMLPEQVVAWAGLSGPNPTVEASDELGPQKRVLSYWNDFGDMNFNQIADLIEKQL